MIEVNKTHPLHEAPTEKIQFLNPNNTWKYTCNCLNGILVVVIFLKNDTKKTGKLQN